MILVQAYRILTHLFEPPTSTLKGIDHAPKVKKSSINNGEILSLVRDILIFFVCALQIIDLVRNQAQQLLAPCAA